jgi:midasin (ATPase involved in ribosome maturation)
MDDAQNEEAKGDPRDLIDEYESYLKAKADEKMDVDNGDDSEDDKMRPASRFIQQLEQFDYMEQKALIRNRFQEWITDEREHTQALQLLAKFKNQTQSVSSSLCEQLRIVLEP